jgi:hypothetical protein
MMLVLVGWPFYDAARISYNSFYNIAMCLNGISFRPAHSSLNVNVNPKHAFITIIRDRCRELFNKRDGEILNVSHQYITLDIQDFCNLCEKGV